jgi:hypothetical protein
MAMTARLNTRDWSLIAGAATLPFLILTIYLVASRWLIDRFGAASDFFAIGVGLLATGLCIWLIEVRRSWRVVAIVMCLPALYVALLMYGLEFVCSAFDDCL